MVGGLHNVPGLLALGGTIVGGVLGNSMPARAAAATADTAAPTSPPVITRRRRRRLTPGAAAFGPDSTLRNRLPGGSPE